MQPRTLAGVIAAVATAIDEQGGPDCQRSIALARSLLAQGCNGLNVLGTTGEATSFSVDQRRRLMTAYREAGLPMAQLMVGTGAAAVADAVSLTQYAAELGYAGALVLPPFYYKDVSDDGLLAYLETILAATSRSGIAIYLYHFPVLAGCGWNLRLLSRVRAQFGDRVAGLKDSSGDLGFARAAVEQNPGLAVFPSNEATLEQQQDGFAGCISASVNLNADLCGRWFRQADRGALTAAVAIRRLFDGKPLIAGIKAVLAHLNNDAAWAAAKPPLRPLPADVAAHTVAAYETIRRQQGGSASCSQH
jgi:4-hydroxy-tetrahydrodipicolinate synthase